MKKFLIINIFGIGDVLFTTPLIRNIKKNYPDSFIGYVCNLRALPVLANNADVDKIFIYEKDDYKELFKGSKITFFKKVNDAFSEIKKEKFDTCIDLSLNFYASFFMWVLQIPQRIGFNYKNRSLFLNEKIELEGYEKKHVIEYYCEILERLGMKSHSKEMALTPREVDFQYAGQIISKCNPPKNLLVGFVPGGGASWGKDAACKRWPVRKYAELADKLVEKFSANIILLGDKNEQKLCSQVLGQMKHPAVSVCGETSIGQLAAVFSKCSLVLVNDGGPLHIATAVGSKTVSIFGPVDENVYGPYPTDGHLVVTAQVSCRPCYRKFKRSHCTHFSCLNDITADDVLEKIEKLAKN